MGHANTPPQLPEVRDEAGDTPRWVPVLGVLLFALATLTIVICHTGCSAAPPAAAERAP
jgi:hypothetical protein